LNRGGEYAIALFRPRPAICDCRHQQYSCRANEDLNPKRIQAQFDRGLGTKGQDDAKAKDW
jgi:hypothetical protein